MSLLRNRGHVLRHSRLGMSHPIRAPYIRLIPADARRRHFFYLFAMSEVRIRYPLVIWACVDSFYPDVSWSPPIARVAPRLHRSSQLSRFSRATSNTTSFATSWVAPHRFAPPRHHSIELVFRNRQPIDPRLVFKNCSKKGIINHVF